MSIKYNLQWIIIKSNSKYCKGKERPYIISYLVYLLIYIFVKFMAQSNSRGNKKKLIRVYNIKQWYITKTKTPYQKGSNVTMKKMETYIRKK